MRTVLAIAVLALAATPVFAQEVCDNALDDDGDGLIDLNDTTDCTCDAVLGGVGELESIIPNPSFEELDCCPASWSGLDCATTWVQATSATSDFFHTCDFMPNIVPQPLPDGNGVVGGAIVKDFQGPGSDYIEYVGACLDNTMVAGTSYSIELSISATASNTSLTEVYPDYAGPLDITIFGLANCGTLPLATSACPEPFGWVALGSTSYTPTHEWTSITITFTPTFDVNAVIIGGPCDLPADYTMTDEGQIVYVMYDGLLLNESALFGSTITSTGHLCTSDLVLHGATDTLTTGVQWYQGGVALVGQTDTLLNVSALGLDTGTYQFMAVLDTACATSVYHLAPSIYPEPSLSASPVSGCAPLEVAFTHATDPALTASLEWDFGDGSPTDASETPEHTYDNAGTYDVTLTVTSPEGCSADTTYQDLITAFALPVASFTAAPNEGCTGLAVTFTNTSQNSAECSWNFGDPPGSDICDPSHTYNIAGTYDVSLSVTSADGCTDDTLVTDLITVYDAPDVSFTTDTVAGCVPLTIHFSNTTPPDQTGSVHWDLGNGALSDQSEPVGVYEDPGQYTVSLLVTHPQGCSAEVIVTDMITAFGHPVVSFTNQPDSGCYPLEVTFANTTDAAFTGTCAWAFGDGTTAADCHPVHVYPDPGVFSVSLEVISPQNCQGDTTYPDLVTVFDHPVSEFTFGPQPADYFNTYISFVDASSIDAIQWNWSFGTGGSLGTSTDEFPSLHFPSEDLGTYPVQLVVTNVHTCTDTITHDVVIDGYYAVYVPNTFTPDGDGVNDLWRPIIKDQIFKDYQLRLFDRWGREIWASTDPDESWDGKLGGEFAMTGVYAWRLDTRDLIAGFRHEYCGHVSLLK